MIDWQIEIDGKLPDGWDSDRDGCWFPDFDHQEYLLPYFDVGDTGIDLYGRTEFGTADMARLKDRIESWMGCFESKPMEWTVTDSSDPRNKPLRLQRDSVLEVFLKTLMMIERAQKEGGTLVFLGD